MTLNTSTAQVLILYVYSFPIADKLLRFEKKIYFPRTSRRTPIFCMVYTCAYMPYMNDKLQVILMQIAEIFIIGKTNVVVHSYKSIFIIFPIIIIKRRKIKKK